MPDPSVQRSIAAKEGFTPIRITPELTISAAARLIGDGTPQKQHSARRMINAAAVHGIDLSLMWGTVDRAGDGKPIRVREVCLAVPGAGKTAVLLIADPGAGVIGGGHAERVACIRAACQHLEHSGGKLCLAQTLPDPKQVWAVEAFSEAGFSRVGDLAYMRRGIHPLDQPPEPIAEPDVSVRNVRASGGAPEESERHLLIEALNRSYVDTLDCPELCGQRETADVLESHRSTGEWSGRLWWLVMFEGQAHGCMLMNRVPDQGSVELVYLGLSPELRGRGLGARLLAMGLDSALKTDARQITCAVDLRNVPALRLYARHGFTEFGRRVAMVRPLSCPQAQD